MIDSAQRAADTNRHRSASDMAATLPCFETVGTHDGVLGQGMQAARKLIITDPS